MVEELASGAEIEHEVQKLLCTERFDKVDDARVLELGQNLPLQHYLLELAMR